MYIDDGYTGINFNCPGVQRLINDIKIGLVFTVMVKNLSHIGRDYVSAGNYTDRYFPENNIRFIAVNDAIDSDESESEIALFKNIFNEMYARNISKKVSPSHRLRSSTGEPLFQPLYGYMKSPNNKKSGLSTQRLQPSLRAYLKCALTVKAMKPLQEHCRKAKCLCLWLIGTQKG